MLYQNLLLHYPGRLISFEIFSLLYYFEIKGRRLHHMKNIKLLSCIYPQNHFFPLLQSANIYVLSNCLFSFLDIDLSIMVNHLFFIKVKQVYQLISKYLVSHPQNLSIQLDQIMHIIKKLFREGKEPIDNFFNH